MFARTFTALKNAARKLPLVVALLASAIVPTANSQDIPSQVLLQQLVDIPHEPSTVLLTVQLSSGDVRPFPARAIPYVTDEESLVPDSGRTFLLGALIPRDVVQNAQDEIPYTFVILGPNSSFSATPIRTVQREDLVRQSDSAKSLNQLVATLDSSLQSTAGELNEIKTLVDAQREDLMKRVDLVPFMNLRNDVLRLRAVVARRTADKARLTRTLQLAENAEPSDGVDHIRQVLTRQLMETAQVTAMTQRLSIRRREAALASFKKKLSLIREVGDTDAEGLAREVLRLRARRKELESQLNVGESPEPAAERDF